MAILNAGTKVKLNGAALPGCYSYPDMVGSVNRKDVTTYDQEKNKRYMDGLDDISELNFDFYVESGNFSAALAVEKMDGQQYEVEYPSGATYAWTGSHSVYHLGEAPDGAEKFRMSCTVSSDMAKTGGGGGGSQNSGGGLG